MQDVECKQDGIKNKFMKNCMKTFILIIVILLLIIVAFLIYTYFRLPDYQPKVSIIEIYSSNFEEKIFIKRKVWGITGDDGIIVISKSSNKSFEPNTDSEYVFAGLSPFFYSFRNDTLNIYVGKESKKPIEMNTRIKINQIVLTNPEIMKLMENYKEKGLNKVG